jgi:hypothetical protein
LRFAPPICRMPLGPSQASPKLVPEVGPAPGFDIVYAAFDTSSAVRLRSPLSTLPAGIIVPAFPRRSPPRLLTAAARGGLGSAPDCRTRRALLHLSYSYAPPCGPAMLVTHGPGLPTGVMRQASSYLRYTDRAANVPAKAVHDCRKRILGVENASSIQKVDSDDSIVAYQ